MEVLTTDDLQLLTTRQFAHVAVNRPDDAPHVTVTWVDAADGHILVNTAAGRVKERLLRRDPRVSVTIHREGDGYRWLRVEGTVAEFVTGPEAERHIDTLKLRYQGSPWTYVPGQVRVLVKIRPDRILRRDE